MVKKMFLSPAALVIFVEYAVENIQISLHTAFRVFRVVDVVF